MTATDTKQEKPKVGQRFYSLNVSNVTRNRKQKLTPVTVIKVGRKYFTCRHDVHGIGYKDTIYYIDSRRENTASNFQPT